MKNTPAPPVCESTPLCEKEAWTIIEASFLLAGCNYSETKSLKRNPSALPPFLPPSNLSNVDYIRYRAECVYLAHTASATKIVPLWPKNKEDCDRIKKLRDMITRAVVAGTIESDPTHEWVFPHSVIEWAKSKNIPLPDVLQGCFQAESLGGQNLPPESSRPKTPNNRGGRPKYYDKKADDSLVKAWESAKRAGSRMEEFCDVKGIHKKTLQDTIDRVRKRKSRLG